MNRSGIIAAVFLVVIVIGAFIYFQVAGSRGGVDIHSLVYSSPTYGFSFNYPDTYALTEGDFGAGTNMHHSITLADKTDLANLPQNGEGPPAIIIQIFPNKGNQSLLSWVKGASDSNFKLSVDGKLSTTTIASQEAVGYTWDGLYRAESVVAAHKGNVLMFSVMYNAPTDDILSDYKRLVASTQFF